MRNSLLLLMLGTVLTFGTSSPLRAQAPPAAATPNPTNERAYPGVLPAPVVFEWKSGNLIDFVAHIKRVFGIDLSQSADIPNQMLGTRVPSMKITTANVWQVLELYNMISDDYPGSGKWAVKRIPSGTVYGGPGIFISEPNAVFLVPPKQTDLEESLSVRAFTLRDIPETERKLLFDLVKEEADRLKLETGKGIKAAVLRGDIHFHPETGICVARGGKAYVEMVGSLIDAFREGRRVWGGNKPYTPKTPDAK